MDDAIEKEIQEKGLTAPRITPDDIENVVLATQYYVFPGTMLTVCCITLKNGFNVVGESACASPDNFDQEVGEKIANRNARDKIWALEGYLLKQRLFHKAVIEGDPVGEVPEQTDLVDESEKGAS